MIHIGYELISGAPIQIPLRHLAVTGQTQESGKTTTLEALISRSGLRGIVFLTKRGETGFRDGKRIPPYFKERADWPFVSALCESVISEKLKFQRSWIMRICQEHDDKDGQWKTPTNLAEVMANLTVAQQKARGINASVYIELKGYLATILPEIEKLSFSSRIELEPYLSPVQLHVMDLSAFGVHSVQALVIQSVLERIRQDLSKTISVIPESWKFAPRRRGSPVRLAAEALIREGAALENFIWLDSQDIVGVADVLLRQVGVWVFGVQRSKYEIERTLAHIPADHRKPRASEIATLEKGQFIVCYGREMAKVYVQPVWMSGAHAQAIARGEEPVSSARPIFEQWCKKGYGRRTVAGPIAGPAGEEDSDVWKRKCQDQRVLIERLQAEIDALRAQLSGSAGSVR